MNKSRTDLDRLFEKGISDVAREPRKSLSEEDIAAAAAASKSGTGVFLRSHTKEIILCLVSIAAICLITIAALHFSEPKTSEPKTEMTILTEDTIALSTETPLTAVETFHETSPQNEDHSIPSSVNPLSRVTNPTSNITNPTSNVTSQTSHLSHSTPDATTANPQVPTPNSPEPVVIKKTIVQRDTVVLNETVIIKDTTYVP